MSVMDSVGPSLIWIRIGNCRNVRLIASLDSIFPRVIEALKGGTNDIDTRPVLLGPLQ